MFSWLGTLFILTVIFYAFYIPLKKLYYALSPKKRAIHEAGEEWKMRNEIQNRKRNEMIDLHLQESRSLRQWMELDREDFDTEEAYQAEDERLRAKYKEVEEADKEATREWEKAQKKAQEAFDRYIRIRDK